MLAGGGDLVVVTSPNLNASTEDIVNNSDFITAILTVSPAANPPASFLAEIFAEMDSEFRRRLSGSEEPAKAAARTPAARAEHACTLRGSLAVLRCLALPVHALRPGPCCKA